MAAKTVATVTENADFDGGELEVNTTGVINTLEVHSFEDRKNAFNALNNAVSLDDMGDTPISIVGIVQRPGIRVDRNTGDVVDCSDTTFIGDDGKGYFSKSGGIARSAQNLVATFGTKWPVPIVIKVVKTVLPNKNTLKSIEVQ